jgi:LytS/YehU family sensor histidine kinase
MLENQNKLFQSKKELEQALRINNKNKIIFGVLISLAMLLIFTIFLKNRNTKLINEQDRLRLEQRVLRSQMNPHFIFNALSAIQNSLLDNDPIKSASYLSRFAKLIRQNFDFINQRKILLVEEIDALKNYMDTQKMRFKDKFDYEINVYADVDVNQVEIPPLLLQPLVENAIEHGFKNIKEQGIVTINISRKGSKICYKILDNGSGFLIRKSDKKTHALDIFKKRLKLLNNKDAESFNMDSSDKGTTLTFCLEE